jgi:hypothetical protein
MTNIDLPPEELSAALAARLELGKAYERDLAESFIDRIEKSIDARVDAKVAEQVPQRRQRQGGQIFGQITQMVLGIVSVSVGVPITHFAHGTADTLIAWAGLVGVNVANAMRGRWQR